MVCSSDWVDVMAGKIAINGMGNTGCSLLVKIAEKIAQNEEPLPITAAHDLFVDRDEIISVVNAGFCGEPAVKLTSKGSNYNSIWSRINLRSRFSP